MKQQPFLWPYSDYAIPWRIAYYLDLVNKFEKAET